MQPIDFSADAPGKILKTAQEYYAFLPNPLPPPLQLREGLILEISNADRALGELTV